MLRHWTLADLTIQSPALVDLWNLLAKKYLHCLKVPWKAKVLSQDYLSKETSKKIHKITSVSTFCLNNAVTQSHRVSGKQHRNMRNLQKVKLGLGQIGWNKEEPQHSAVTGTKIWTTFLGLGTSAWRLLSFYFAHSSEFSDSLYKAQENPLTTIRTKPHAFYAQVSKKSCLSTLCMNNIPCWWETVNVQNREKMTSVWAAVSPCIREDQYNNL